MAAAQDLNLINAYNSEVKKLLTCYQNVKSGISNPQNLGNAYMRLSAIYKEMRDKLKKVHWDKVYKEMKYSKPKSIQKRSQDIWSMVMPFVGKTIMRDPINIAYIEAAKMEIKNLTNDVRMGMRNYFASNEDVVAKEIDKIKGTVFVIFDDNISGGATLSDICYQAKKLGIEYVVPITFGVMKTKYTMGTANVNKPNKNGMFDNY